MISVNNNQDIKPRKNSTIIKIIGFMSIGIIASFGLGFIVMWLWNSLMPDIFNLKTITYWQAIGLFVLIKILVGGVSTTSNHHKANPSAQKQAEIKTEIENEFDSFDDEELYEIWWKETGEKSFEEFMQSKYENDEKRAE